MSNHIFKSGKGAFVIAEEIRVKVKNMVLKFADGKLFNYKGR